MDSVPEELAAIKRRLDAAERRLAAWDRLIVAAEAGGGYVTVGDTQVILRINSLTTTAVQVP